MYAKIFIILVLAILCTGCTDPDLPDMDPDAFENVTPGAPALKKSWDSGTQTITISTLDDTPRLTIKKVSAVPDLGTFEEVLEIKSFVDYDLNKLKDFRARWKKHKGQHDITKVEWFILKNESYHITVDDYENIQVEETHYDNVTEEYYNVTVNQTVLIGNHSEVRYHDIWKPFSPIGKSIHVGQTYTVKIVYNKPAEIGNVQIQTVPMFAGIECEELTWWNSSWDYKIDSTVTDVAFPYQMNLTIHGGSGTNNVTDVFLNGHNNTDFSDIRFTLDDTTELAYWIQDNTTDTVKCWINVTANGTVNLYYGNLAAIDISDGISTFIFFDDFNDNDITDWNTGDFQNLVGTKCIVSGGEVTTTGTTEAWMKRSLPTSITNNYTLISQMQTGGNQWASIQIGSDSANTYYAHVLQDDNDDYKIGTDERAAFGSSNPVQYLDWGVSGTTYYVFENKHIYGSAWTIGLNGDDITASLNVNNADSTVSTISDIAFGCRVANDKLNWVALGYHSTSPPAWGTWGPEQVSSIITAYTPSTPLSKTTGDSQLFTVNTSETSQCRWYINGSLMQTNSSGATRHEYLNSSLDEGYWNFTATANTTDMTSSQTWWVTVSAVGTFEQDMYAGRWMYVTYLDGGNTNLSEFFTDLAPYYLSFYNATDQKTYNYKSGRWEKYADKIIKPREVAMMRYTSNVTKTQDNASGTFGLTLQTGLNHIGHSYNGSRTLSWYNTTIASANLVTIEHQNPENGTISTFTYGSADNATVEVLQGFGVEVNVSADTVISGL